MSYLVEQKVGDKVYVYESKGYWDKEKKQCRQKRTYLGRKDPETGGIIKTKYSPRSVKVKSVTETGGIHVSNELMTQIGLRLCIERCFESQSDAIVSLLNYMLLDSGPYYLQQSWAEQTGSVSLSSQRISELLVDIGENSGKQDQFFREWNQLLGHQKACYMDITSLSSYATNIDFLEWGYNRDGESLQQLNLGVLIGETSGLPLMYRVYPGSISDVATLKTTVEIGRDQYGLDTEQLIMDRGFYSQYNITEMVEAGHTFILPMPFSVNLAKTLLSSTKTALQSPMEAFSIGDDAFFYCKEQIIINEIPLIAHIYVNDGRRSSDTRRFMRRLSDLESALSEQTFYNIPMAKEFLDAHMRYSSTLFELSYNEGSVTIKRRRNVLSRWLNRFGKMIILTNDPSLSKIDIIHHYRQKDCVEKYYDNLKNALNQSRLRVHSQCSTEGHLFMTFLTSIMYMALSSRMKQANLFKSLSIPELLSKLKTIRSVSIADGQDISTEIPKKVRTILQKLSVPLPN